VAARARIGVTPARILHGQVDDFPDSLNVDTLRFHSTSLPRSKLLLLATIERRAQLSSCSLQNRACPRRAVQPENPCYVVDRHAFDAP
jgi:hypothetical protein